MIRTNYLFIVAALCLFILTFCSYKWNAKTSSNLLLCNVEALANNAEVDFDFCVVTSGICVIYSDGLAIKGYKLYWLMKVWSCKRYAFTPFYNSMVFI